VIDINDVEFDLLRSYLRETSGIAVSPEKRYLFATRLTPLLIDRGCKNFSEFYRLLKSERGFELRNQVVEAMTTNETSFFRDRHPFEALSRCLLPELAAKRQHESCYSQPRIRIFCAGCSTGEEPYTVGICLLEWLERQEEEVFALQNLSVMAVDISRTALDHARLGVYDSNRIHKQLPKHIVTKYFVETSNGLRARSDLRALITFSELNLSEPLERLGRFDIILCRNVFIYFSAELKRSILEQFYRMLLPGGMLLMGASESMYQLCDSYLVRQVGATICYVKED